MEGFVLFVTMCGAWSLAWGVVRFAEWLGGER